MPLQRRIPKRGFTQRNRTVYQIVNVGDLARIEGTTVTAELLKEAGLIRSSKGLVKVLAMGEVSQAYSVEAHKFSGGAVAKIEAAGGSTTVLKSGGSDSTAKGSKLQKKRGPKASAGASDAPAAAEAPGAAEEAPVEEVAAEAETGTEAEDAADAPVEDVVADVEAPAAEAAVGDDVEAPVGEAETDG